MIVIEGSSIFNIDYAAGVFSGVLHPDQAVRLFLNEKPTLSENPKHRKFISRLSLPLFKWIYATNNDINSNDNVWHLEYIPSEEFTKENAKEKLSEIEMILLQLLKKGNCTGFSDGIIKRFERLRDISENIKISNNRPFHIALYAEIIKTIFDEVLNKKHTIEFIGGFTKLDTSPNNKYHYLLNNLYRLIKNKNGERLKFIKGGYLEIKRNRVWSKSFKTDIVSLINKNLHFKSSTDPKVDIPIKIHDITNAKKSKYSFSCRGPIQMLLLEQFGQLSHLPWYGEAEIDDANPSCYEFISPISVSDKSRVSTRFGGAGNRLEPAGYSLLDYESEEVLCLIRGICDDQLINFGSLSDWTDLANNYPITHEKLAEHQREVKTYVKFRTDFAQKQLRSGGLVSNHNLFKNVKEISFAEFGLMIIEYSLWLRHLRTILSPDNNIHLKETEIRILQSNNWIGDDGSLNIKPLINNINFIFTKTGDKLVQLGFEERKWEALKANFDILSEGINTTSHFPITKGDLIQFKKYNHIGQLAPALELILEYYYSFASFAVSTLFKANIFTCYILFGPEKYNQLIGKIFEKRGRKKQINYKPIFLKSIDIN